MKRSLEHEGQHKLVGAHGSGDSFGREQAAVGSQITGDAGRSPAYSGSSYEAVLTAA